MPAGTHVDTASMAGVGKPEEKEPAGGCDGMVRPPRYGDCGLRSGRVAIFGAALDAFDRVGLSMEAPEAVISMSAEVAQSPSRKVFGDSPPTPIDDRLFGSAFRLLRAGRVMTYRS